MYVIKDGEVFFVTQDTLCHVCGTSGRLAVMFDDDGVLHKHGEASLVRARRSEFLEKVSLSGFDWRMNIVDFDISQPTIEEINACIACSGRVATIATRLAEFSPSFAA